MTYKNETQKPKIGDLSLVAYILLCFLTLGTVWAVKLAVQKAIVDSYK